MLLGSSASGGQIALGVRFYLNDQFSTPVKNMQSAMKGYKDEFQAFQENLRAARNVSLGVAAAGAMATRGMYSAAMEGAEFLYVMKGVEAITEATNEQMASLNKLAIGLGRQTMFMPEDIASGMRFMAMAGQDALTIQKTIGAFTNLAGATMTQLGGKMGAADIGTNALKAFGWEAERSAEMSDILVAATTNANVSLVDLGNSIRYVSATSRNLQVPVQETIGLLMTLGNAGIQSSMAGTALENMYRYLARSLTSNASKKAQEAWQSMGLSRTDVTTAAGRFKPMVDILGMMNKSMEGMDPIQVQAIFRNIFGVRGVRGAATIARNLGQAKDFVGMLSDEKQIGGTAAEKMKIMMDNLQGASLQLISTWRGLKVAFAEATGKALIPLMKVLKKVLTSVTDFISTPIGGFIATAIFGVTALTTVVFGLKAAFLSVAYAAKSMTVSVGGMKAASKIMAGFMGFGGMGGGFNLFRAGSAGVYGPAAMSGPASTRLAVTGAGATSRFRSRATGRFVSPGASVIPIRPLTLATQGATKTLKAASPLLRGLGVATRGVLGFISGPWGLALMAGMALMPTIIDALSGNTAAVRNNTKAIREEDAPLDKEIFAMLHGKQLGEIVQVLKDGMLQAEESKTMTDEHFKALIENGDMNTLVRELWSLGGGATIAGDWAHPQSRLP